MPKPVAKETPVPQSDGPSTKRVRKVKYASGKHKPGTRKGEWKVRIAREREKLVRDFCCYHFGRD